MSEEQFDELIGAIEASGDFWQTCASVALGALLALGVGWVQRWWTRRDQGRESRRQASSDAAAWGYRFAVAPTTTHMKLREDWMERSGEVIVALTNADPSDRVAGWVVRQMSRLHKMLSDGSTTGQRVHVAYSISHRLALWCNGKESSAAFAPDRDDAWDQRFAAASATI